MGWCIYITGILITIHNYYSSHAATDGTFHEERDLGEGLTSSPNKCSYKQMLSRNIIVKM